MNTKSFNLLFCCGSTELQITQALICQDPICLVHKEKNANL